MTIKDLKAMLDLFPENTEISLDDNLGPDNSRFGGWGPLTINLPRGWAPGQAIEITSGLDDETKNFSDLEIAVLIAKDRAENPPARGDWAMPDGTSDTDIERWNAVC